MTEIQRTELDINTASRMPIQDFINRVLWATSREAAGKQATGMGMFGYSMQDAIDAMIEAQEVS